MVDVSREAPVDLLVIGGGINGAGIARDAAGRGLSVVLCEQGDLGSATSSASTKLIHGGLRYLEHYEFRLVRAALIEREVLLRAAPHIIRPLRFVLPHEETLRPAWLIRLGLFLYDHLAGPLAGPSGQRRRLPDSRAVDPRRHPAGRPLSTRFIQAFEYSDCWVEDARLVLLNAIDAQERGACIRTRTRFLRARRDGGLWRADLESAEGGGTVAVRARGLVNAAGPWVGEVLNHRITAVAAHGSIRLVKGSHIVVPRLYDGEHAYLFQNDDRRIVFAIPYERVFTLIGTTDVDYSGDPAAAAITPAEVAYLCRTASRFFASPVAPEQVVWTYSGVRPLFNDDTRDASAVTRDYVLELDAPAGRAPLLSIFGGKITTYRRLAEQAMARLRKPLGIGRGPWTAGVPLPGGDIPRGDVAGFLDDLRRLHPWLPAEVAWRYARTYGTRVAGVLDGARSLADLGPSFGPGVYEAELRHAVTREFVGDGADFLWRRTKLGLHLDAGQRDAVAAWIATHRAGTVAASGSAPTVTATTGR